MQKAALYRAASGLALAALLVVGYFWLRAPEATFVKIGQKAPELVVPSFGGKGATTRLSSFRGRPVLLTFFLTDCHICNDDIGEIEKIHRRFLWDGLVVLGVASDSAEEAAKGSVEDFVKRHDITFLVLEDHYNEAVYKAFHTKMLPETYLIDAAGVVQAIYLGHVTWSSNAVYDKIRSVMPPGRPQPPGNILPR
jgi:peroxiredoxin